ncbi:translation initiation factor IF-2-like [Onychomys torridus]|uniref:translation initiation factor IF-2-like n=1 Tax=Onychomys torridus TaxID=38674 RepID=UPI00167F6B90|nr:translation initiation factor IF-2-like [Onychomys torridus]
MAPGPKPTGRREAASPACVPQPSSKATGGTQGFNPRHHSNSENESLRWHEAGKYVGTATNNSTSFAEVSTRRRREPGSEPDAEGPGEQAGGGEGSREAGRHPPAPTAAEETEPATEPLKPRPGQGAVSPDALPACRRALPEQAPTPPWPQSPHNTDWRESARAGCHSANRPDFGKPPPPRC